MILALAILGALIGWLLNDFEGYGLIIGGIPGAVVGFVCRLILRHEIASATADLRAQVEAIRAALQEERFATGNIQDRTPQPASFQPVAPQPVSTPTEPDPTPTIPVANPRPAIGQPPAPAPQPLRTGQTPSQRRIPTGEPGPDIFGKAFTAAKNWLFGGNTIVRIGLVLLFVGLSFLASYAAAAGLFPIELRLALVGLAGVALLVFGFQTRIKRPEFGLALQGGGVATLYLTLFAAARLFDVVPAIAAFALMILVCALGCALALLQRSQAMAVTSFAGGFAVPLLLSTGGGNIAGVFAYYTVLNLAILFIAQKQVWRGLNLIGFFATFGVTSAWMLGSYTPSDYAVGQAFVIMSVLIYLATAVLYTSRTPGIVGNVVDTTLLFGPALAGFGLQVGLVHHIPYGSAFAALGFAAIYLALSAFMLHTRPSGFRVMNEAMLAIGIGFVTLAVPLALGASWTSAVWALEGAGAFWVGMRQARWMPRLFGLALQGVAALTYLSTVDGGNVSSLPIINPGFIGAALIAIAGLITAWWLRKPLPHSGSWLAEKYAEVERALSSPVFLFGFVFWWGAWIAEAARYLPATQSGTMPMPVFGHELRVLLSMLAFVVSAWIAQTFARRTAWSVATWPSYVSLVVIGLTFLTQLETGGFILELPGLPIWIVAIGLHLHMLYRNDHAATGADPILSATHIGGAWLAVGMLANCLWLGITRADLWDTSWAGVVFLISAIAVLSVLTLWAGPALRARAATDRWPRDKHATDYAWYAAVPIALLVVIGSLTTALLASGEADPLPYIPVLNPVDLSLALALGALALWRQAIMAADPTPPGAAVFQTPGPLASGAALAFIMVNTIWLRIAHHLVGVPWDADALFDSVVVQTGYAILWTLLALTAMIVAHRRVQRPLWLIGAALLGLTVVKLLLIDLNAAHGGARIVAFIAVGVLMLVVGYAAPLPPKAKDEEVTA